MRDEQVGAITPLSTHFGLLVKVDAILVGTRAEGLSGEFGAVLEINLETARFSININTGRSLGADHKLVRFFHTHVLDIAHIKFGGYYTSGFHNTDGFGRGIELNQRAFGAAGIGEFERYY